LMKHVMVSLQIYNVDIQHGNLDQLFLDVSRTTFQEIEAHDFVQ